MKPAVKRDWPLLPKMSWRGVLPNATPVLAGLTVHEAAGLQVDTVPAASVATAADDKLAKHLVGATTDALRVTGPARWQGEPLIIGGPASGVVQIDVGAESQVVIRELHHEAAAQTSLLLLINIEENAQVDLTTLDLTRGAAAIYR